MELSTLKILIDGTKSAYVNFKLLMKVSYKNIKIIGIPVRDA